MTSKYKARGEEIDFSPEEDAALERAEAKLLAMRSRFAGCLLGGGVGDALGAAVEFMSIDEIRRRYGAKGITDYDQAYGRRGAITDDTQMTLFTAEGLLRAATRANHRGGVSDPVGVVHRAYLRWLHTQGQSGNLTGLSKDGDDGWLIKVKGLHSRRAPGMTCVRALASTRELGIHAVNDSKGCGGVMRVAPVALFTEWAGDPFELARNLAALTHGHPSGYYSAGCLAALIRLIIEDRTLPEAVELTLERLEQPDNPGHKECADAILQALNLWVDASVEPAPETIERMGGGWVGEEALAISIYCALAAGDDFAKGVLLAVNHSGDSDSTGAITGNILGAMLGVEAIPQRWLDELEMRAEIEMLAQDLVTGFEESDEWWRKYPGW